MRRVIQFIESNFLKNDVEIADKLGIKIMRDNEIKKTTFYTNGLVHVICMSETSTLEQFWHEITHFMLHKNFKEENELAEIQANFLASYALLLIKLEENKMKLDVI